MKCENCGGLGYKVSVYTDSPCPQCSPASDKFQARIIAAYLRDMLDLHGDETSDAMSDKEIIACHGGDRQNRIIAGEGGTYLYRSIDSTITTYTIIDVEEPLESIGLEAFIVPDPKDEKEIMDSDDLTLPCQSDGWRG